MQTVTEAYIMGIKEGRSMLTNNPDMTVNDMQECLATCARLNKEHSQPMKDVFIGERDFWKNQIKNRKGF